MPAVPRRSATLVAVVACLVVTGCSSSSTAAHHTASQDATSASSVASSPVAAVSPAGTTKATTPTPTPSSTTPSTTASATTTAATAGTLSTVTIPGGSSGFAPRAAELYLPPILRTDPGVRLPVMELLHGVPGSPKSWVTNGDVVTTMNDFAESHGGRAPIVVMPDVNGAERTDTECVRTPSGGNVEQYLTQVVPAWVSAHYSTLSAPQGWALVGLSEGGTCAAMLALRGGVWSTFVDMSGLSRPTIGEKDEPVQTTKVLFGGSSAAFEAHDPTYLLAHNRYPTLGAWFACGVTDTTILPSQRLLVRLARSAGLNVQDHHLPGKHTWQVWVPALAQALPWVWDRIV